MAEGYRHNMKMRGRKDNNHDAIKEAFEKNGCDVLDLSAMGQGVPDLLVHYAYVWHAVEVKNPKTSYGRKGLNKNQLALRDRVGGSIEIVKTIEEAFAMVKRWRHEAAA
jgi:hypothetical protein